MARDYLGKVKDAATLKDQAYRAIKGAIIANQLVPGKSYSVPELAARLGVSRSPVREALLELAARGFVTFLPRKGVVVNELGLDGVKDLFHFRLALERGVLAELLGRGLNAAEREEVATRHQRLLRAAGARKIQPFLKLDRDFHGFLAAATGNRYLIEALANVRDLIDWNNHRLMLRHERIPEVVAEHERLVGALLAGDLAASQAALDAHLAAAIRGLAAFLPPNGTAAPAAPPEGRAISGGA